MSTLHVENLKGLSSGGNANKIILSNDQTLYAPNHIVQVLTQEITAITTTTSNSAVASGFTLTITPKSASSKIKTSVGMNGIYMSSQNTAMQMYIYKNGSFLDFLDDIAGYGITGQNPNQNANPTHIYVDSPNTTSATTYAIFISVQSGTLGFNNYATGNNRTRSWFTVEEIAQ